MGEVSQLITAISALVTAVAALLGAVGLLIRTTGRQRVAAAEEALRLSGSGARHRRDDHDALAAFGHDTDRLAADVAALARDTNLDRRLDHLEHLEGPPPGGGDV